MKNFALIIALLAGAWLFLAFWKSPAEFFFGERTPRTETIPGADSYMENTVTSKFDESGARVYVLRAATGLYYNEEDRFELTDPHLVARRERDIQPWELTARRANTAKGGEQVRLSGDVHAWQSASSGRDEFFTQQLTFHPEDNTAETQAPVKLVHPHGVTRGVGLNADFTAQVYHLLSRVRGQYDAQ